MMACEVGQPLLCPWSAVHSLFVESVIVSASCSWKNLLQEKPFAFSPVLVGVGVPSLISYQPFLQEKPLLGDKKPLLLLGKTHGPVGKPLLGKILLEKPITYLRRTCLDNTKIVRKTHLGKNLFFFFCVLCVDDILQAGASLSSLFRRLSCRLLQNLVFVHRWRCLPSVRRILR